jgi:hypothetical protein
MDAKAQRGQEREEKSPKNLCVSFILGVLGVKSICFFKLLNLFTYAV